LHKIGYPSPQTLEKTKNRKNRTQKENRLPLPLRTYRLLK
jgi:hypothetical protein